MEDQKVRAKYSSQQNITQNLPNINATKAAAQKPVMRKFELRIRLFSSLGNSQLGQGGSFVLTKVKQTTTIFEIKQAIEKLKGYKIESQNLHMPEELAQAIQSQKGCSSFEPKSKESKVQTHMRDDESLQHYRVFELVPYLSNGQQGMPQLFLDVSNRPILVRIGHLQNQNSRVNAQGGSKPQRNKSQESVKSTGVTRNALLYNQVQEANKKVNDPSLAQLEQDASAGESGATGGIQTIHSVEDEVELRVSSGCSVYVLKFLLQQRLLIATSDQVLSFQGQVLQNGNELDFYGIKHQELDTNVKFGGPGQQLVPVGLKSYDIQLTVNAKKTVTKQNLVKGKDEQKQQLPVQNNVNKNSSYYRSMSPPQNSAPVGKNRSETQNLLSTGPIKIQNMAQGNMNLQLSSLKSDPHDKTQGAYMSHNTVQRNRSQTAASLNAYAMQGQQPDDFKSQTTQINKIALGIDFTFNTIKNVRKVTWKDDAPWYREIADGFSWIAYCHNQKCQANDELVVINRGFSSATFSLQKDWQSKQIACPLCKDQKSLAVKNCGFVNCEWTMRGILRKNKTSKIYADGRTYDGKLHTFKECDYLQTWTSLDIQIKDIDPKVSVQNIPDPGSKAYNLRMVQLAKEHRTGPDNNILATDGDESMTSDQIRKIKHDLIHDDLDVAALAHLQKQQAGNMNAYQHPNIQVQMPKLYIQKEGESDNQQQQETNPLQTQGSDKSNSLCVIF